MVFLSFLRQGLRTPPTSPSSVASSASPLSGSPSSSRALLLSTLLCSPSSLSASTLPKELLSIFSSTAQLDELLTYASDYFCEENIHFIQDVLLLKETRDPELVQIITAKYISCFSPSQINIDFHLQHLILARAKKIITLKVPDFTLFDEAFHQVINLVNSDILPRFRILSQTLPPPEKRERLEDQLAGFSTIRRISLTPLILEEKGKTISSSHSSPLIPSPKLSRKGPSSPPYPASSPRRIAVSPSPSEPCFLPAIGNPGDITITSVPRKGSGTPSGAGEEEGEGEEEPLEEEHLAPRVTTWYRGNLFRYKGFLSGWKLRTYVKKGSYLFEFEPGSNHVTSAPKRVIYLEHALVEEAQLHVGRPNTICLTTNYNKTYYLQASSHEEMLEWISELSPSFPSSPLSISPPSPPLLPLSLSPSSLSSPSSPSPPSTPMPFPDREEPLFPSSPQASMHDPELLELLPILNFLESFTDCVVIGDSKGHVLAFNRAASQMFGYSLEEAKGLLLKQLMPEPWASQHDEYLLHYHQSGEERLLGRTRKLRGRRKNGEDFDLRISLGKLHALGYYLATIRDC